MKLAMEINSIFAYVRLGHFELHLERHTERAPEGWLSVTRPVHGEVVLSVGRWALHVVNHRRVDALIAAFRKA